MEPQNPSPVPGLLSLYATQMLERFSYYGMRALLVLFLVDSTRGGLGLEYPDALSIYGNFTWGSTLILIPLALLTDLLIKQKNSLILGCGLSCIGLGLMIPGTYLTTLLGLGLIVVGSGFARPSIPVLIGRGFLKTDRKRDGAMLLNYFFINLGAMAAPILIATVGETYGWSYGFGLAAVTMLLGTGTAILARFTVQEIETNTVTPGFASIKPLNTPPPAPVPFPFERWILIGIIIAMITLFWLGYEITLNGVMSHLSSETAFGEEGMDWNLLTSSGPAFTAILTLIFGLWWAFGKAGSTLLRMGIGCAFFVLSAVTGLVVLNMPNVMVPMVILFLLLQSGAETLLSPLSHSFLTRLSPVKFSSTIMATFFVLPFALSRGIQALIQAPFPPDRILLPILFSILFLGISLLFLLARRPMENLGKGVV